MNMYLPSTKLFVHPCFRSHPWSVQYQYKYEFNTEQYKLDPAPRFYITSPILCMDWGPSPIPSNRLVAWVSWFIQKWPEQVQQIQSRDQLLVGRRLPLPAAGAPDQRGGEGEDRGAGQPVVPAQGLRCRPQPWSSFPSGASNVNHIISTSLFFSEGWSLAMATILTTKMTISSTCYFYNSVLLQFPKQS